MEAYAGKQFVGMDLHRRGTVIVRTTGSGEVLETVRIVDDVERLASAMARAGESPEVVLMRAVFGVAGTQLSDRLDPPTPAAVFVAEIGDAPWNGPAHLAGPPVLTSASSDPFSR